MRGPSTWSCYEAALQRGSAMTAEKAPPTEQFVPNAETIAAMRETREGGGKRFATIEELFEDLHALD
jgi:antitoxin component of RelBE/YafQ-DinJ toxin-antitoxin module